MTVEGVLRAVVDALEGSSVAYMIVGSVASGQWGVARSTQDSDVVVDLDLPRMQALHVALGKDCYFHEGLARSAIDRHSMFNVIHTGEAAKVDLIVSGDSPHSRRALERRISRPLCGRPAWFGSPEDIILAKLVWWKQGGGERQLEDCAGIVRVQAGQLDRAYLVAEAAALGVTDPLERVLR